MMSEDMKRRRIGIAVIIVGVVGLIVSSTFIYSGTCLISPMGSMMGRSNYGVLKDVTGTVEKIGRMEIELDADGKEVEVHGPLWFWQRIGVEDGDMVTARGLFTSVMDPAEGWHEELVPFELTVNGETYGESNSGIPVWMQSLRGS